MAFLEKFFKPQVATLKARQDIGGLAKALRYRADPEIRFAAAVALGELKENRAIEPLVAALQDPSPKVRATAAAALGELGATTAVDALIDRLDNTNEEPTVRLFVAANLQKIGGRRVSEALARHREHYCAKCEKPLKSESDAQPLRRGFDFADAVRMASSVLSGPGRRCKCGAIICAGCLPLRGDLLCPVCGSNV